MIYQDCVTNAFIKKIKQDDKYIYFEWINTNHVMKSDHILRALFKNRFKRADKSFLRSL